MLSAFLHQPSPSSSRREAFSLRFSRAPSSFSSSCSRFCLSLSLRVGPYLCCMVLRFLGFRQISTFNCTPILAPGCPVRSSCWTRLPPPRRMFWTVRWPRLRIVPGFRALSASIRESLGPAAHATHRSTSVNCAWAYSGASPAPEPDLVRIGPYACEHFCDRLPQYFLKGSASSFGPAHDGPVHFVIRRRGRFRWKWRQLVRVTFIPRGG